MYWTALIMGLTGSLHCAGMCSPLILAATSSGNVVRNRLIYNFGRIMMYGILGLLSGSVGSIVLFNQFRDILTIALGVVLLGLSLLGITNIQLPFIYPVLSKALLWFKRIFASTLAQRTSSSVFLLGFLNGILPCGLTFAALLVGFSLGTWQGAAFMITFGLGTLPVMVGFVGGLFQIIKRLNLSLTRMASILLFVSGCLLVARVFVSKHEHTSTQATIEPVICR